MKTSPKDGESSDSPPLSSLDHSPRLSALNARAGLVLFAIYSTAYLVFVLLSAFAPQAMGVPTALGPNVAILYGFGLILGALVLALVYMLWCHRNERLVAEEARS